MKRPAKKQLSRANREEAEQLHKSLDACKMLIAELERRLKALAE